MTATRIVLTALSTLLCVSLPSANAQGGPVAGEAPDTPVHHDGRSGAMPDPVRTLDSTAGIVPKSARTRKNGYSNAIPWSWTPSRYQQVYRGDELPQVLVIGFLAYRNNLRADAGARVQVEIKLGVSSFDETTLTSIYANNWKTGTMPTTVFTRKQISLPNMTPNLDPAQFHFEIKLDRSYPWRRVANTHLLKEINTFSNSNNSSNFFYYLNAESGSTTTRVFSDQTATSGTVGRGYGLVTRFSQISEANRVIGKVAGYGTGCAGTGTGPGNNCITANPMQQGVTNGTLQAGRPFVMECIAPAATTIRAVEFYASALAAGPLTVQFYRAAGLQPAATPAATTTATVTTTASWARGQFPTPLAVTEGERFYVGFVTSITGGLNPIGIGGELPRYFWNGPNWSGPWEAFAFSYRVECASPTAVPAMTGGNEPTIGCPHDVGVAFAKPMSPAILWLGASRLNVDLGAAVGATGCRLYASPDISLTAVTSANGDASFPFVIPSTRSLIGAKVPHQWMVLDSAANSFGFVFTRGSELQVGGL